MNQDMVAKKQGLSQLLQIRKACRILSGRQRSQFRQLEQRKYSMEILNNYRHKLDEKLDCFSGTETFKVSRDAQLHPWACAMFTDRNSLFALPDVDRPCLPHQWLNTLISRHEFVKLEALVWLIARSLLFDTPSRNFPKKDLVHSRIKIASFALKLSEDWDTHLRRYRV